MNTLLVRNEQTTLSRVRQKPQYKPFEQTRRFIARFGIKSKTQYQQWAAIKRKDGRRLRPDFPKNPQAIYADCWQGWGHFLSKRNWIRRFVRDHNKTIIRKLEEKPINWTELTDEAYVADIRKRQCNGWVFIKFDLTFAASGDSPSEDFWRDHYAKWALPPVRRLTCESSVMDETIAEYEFGIRGKSRKKADWRCPHHIHAILGFQCRQELADEFAKRLEVWGNDPKRRQWLSSAYAAVIPDNDDDVTKTVRKAFYYMRKGKRGRTLN